MLSYMTLPTVLLTLPLSVSVRIGMAKGLRLYSTFPVYWLLETLYNTCHIRTHVHTLLAGTTVAGTPTCASAITAHTHAHTPGAIGCKNWGSDFAHGLLDSRGQGSTSRLVDDCPASLSFCRHYWATATNLLPSHLAGQHGRITWP